MTLFVVRLTMGLLSGRMTFRQNTLHVSPGFWNTKIQGNFFSIVCRTLKDGMP